MWDNLKASIAFVVRTNNNQEITGANLQNVLNTIVNTVGANATFAGIAVPSTNPGTPDGPVFYIACEPGVYSNFNLTLVDGPYILENKTGSWVGTRINTGAAFEALIGYYNAVLNGTSITVPDATTYRLTVGGDFKLKMPAAATSACTLTIGNATDIPIWYDDAAVSSTNTWEAGEIISVFYDGTRFMASNSQGGAKFSGGQKVSDITLEQTLGSGVNSIVSQKGISDAIFNEIDINDIDDLKNLADALKPSSSLKPTYYTVTAVRGSVVMKVGSMAVISDNMGHVVTEIMSTHYLLDTDGYLTDEHDDAEVFTIFRSVKGNGGTLPTPVGTWTAWKYINQSVWPDVASVEQRLLAMMGYYVCDTAAGTAAKTVAATSYSLTNGGCIRIKMNNANTANNVTLNINSTGAKALYYDGAQASSANTWEAGEVLEVYYDGTQYQCASGGGGKFASGEKVKETSITDDIEKDSNDLITSGAIYDELYETTQYPFELGTIEGTTGQDITQTNGTRMRSKGYVPRVSNKIYFHLTRTVTQVNVILYKNGVYAGWIDRAFYGTYNAGDYTYTVNVNYEWDTYRLMCVTTGATAANVASNFSTISYSVIDYLQQQVTSNSSSIAEINEELSLIDSVLPKGEGGTIALNLSQSDYSEGNIDSRNGNILTTNQVIYLTDYLNVSDAISLSYSLDNSYRLGVAIYNGSKMFVRKDEWYTGTGTYSLDNVAYIRIVIAIPSGGSTFDYSAANPQFSLYQSGLKQIASLDDVDEVYDHYDGVLYSGNYSRFELGTIDGANGQEITKTDGTRIRSKDYIPKGDGTIRLTLAIAITQMNVILYKNGVYAGWIDRAFHGSYSAGNYTYKINTQYDYDTYRLVCNTTGATTTAANNSYVYNPALTDYIYNIEQGEESINIEALNTAKIYQYYDALVAAFPNYLSMRVLGMDSTGQHEIREYVATLRDNYAYLYKERCYAWKNGSTTIFTQSVSPRVGDATYSDQLTTSTGYTVSASNCNNRTITVNGTVYNRQTDEDLAADIQYRSTGTSASITVNSKVYNRFPSYDYASTRKKTIVTISNEHGPGPNGDPREPSVVMYYLLKALCGDTNDNPKLDWLKRYAKLVIIPVANPYAYDEEGNASQLGNMMGRVNVNGVNINRNYPTANWTSIANNEGGAYGGSEIETQYNINCIMRHNADIAIDEHCLGPNTNNYNKCYYTGPMSTHIPSEIKMMFLSTYNLAYGSYGAGDAGHSDTWITGQGIDGCLLEMNQGYGETLHADIILRADRAIWMGVLEYYEIFNL